MMPLDPDRLLTAAMLLMAVLAVVGGALAAWNNWLALRRHEFDAARIAPEEMTHPGTRIEIADLKERVRRLEAIAAGVDP